MPVVVAAVEAVEAVEVVIKAIVEENVDEIIIVVIIFLDETDNGIIEFVAVHVFVFVNVDKSDIHIIVLFVVEDSEGVKVVGQGGTSPHSHRHHRHHSGYREQQNNALHTNKLNLLKIEGGELPRPLANTVTMATNSKSVKG